ncbi:ZIP family metal transporter [Caulobacter sp. S45]|uniref:ZIP family metal transporter n=1 Tax=Caulobacter sp. S45 TaxID=1641861 RepID=UPI001575C9C2|nr:ZIP family metal transporter [Caulobacter sp. S45]
MKLDIWLLGVATFVCTLAGGVLALRLGERIRLITGLSAGAVVGLAIFDLVPEAFRIGGGGLSLQALMLALALGFAIYMVAHRALERLSGSVSLNHLGAASLTLHSFFDGLGIGLAFKLSPVVGQAVAIAVLAHDLCDGINIVTVALTGAGRQARRSAQVWLCVNAAAPLAGIAVASTVPVSAATFAPLTAGFAGVFLYIGAAELLPRSYAGLPSAWTSTATVMGMLGIYCVVRLVG